MPLLAYIPFFELRVWNIPVPAIGEIPVDPWATLVCTGFVLGLEMARARAIKMGLDVADVVDGTIVTVLTGFFVAHVVTVVAYFPERLTKDGIWAILRVWEGFSSTGGFIGAVIGSIVFYTWVRPREYLRYADIITYGFPLGWFFGRMGCGVVHDHIGAPTTFPLAMNFPPGHFAAGPRHELGLYEAALMLPVIALFVRWGRTDRPPGFFLAAFAMLYAPVRFLLDGLRNVDLEHQDARYLGLTPAQYFCVGMFFAGAALMASRDWRGFRPWALDGEPDQARRARETAEIPADVEPTA